MSRRRGFGYSAMSRRRGFVSAVGVYPEITLPDPNSISIDSELVSSYLNFNSFWRNSPYHLGDGVSKIGIERLNIERYSDSLKPKSSKSKGSFYDLLLLRPDNFPKDFLGNQTLSERPVKRAKWSHDADLLKLDVFEKLEAKYNKAKGEEEKEEEGDDDDEVDEGDSEGEESDNGDYNHNQDFDDDDDDYNQADDAGFEHLL